MKSRIYNHMIRIFMILTFQAPRLKFACLLLIMFCCLRPAKLRQFPSNIGFSEIRQNRCCFSNILKHYLICQIYHTFKNVIWIDKTAKLARWLRFRVVKKSCVFFHAFCRAAFVSVVILMLSIIKSW